VKVLGISASHLKWGNTDILVHHVLQGAAEEGAEIRFLRLTDFAIRQCRGCLSCLLKNRDCTIGDDFSGILDALREADGVALGSPIQILFAAGSLQMLIPRLFRQGYTGELSGKPGVALVVGGMPGWEGWALSQVVLFFLSLGMPVLDRFIGYGQGPGEIFYDTKTCNRALEAGKAMARGETAYRGDSGTCPVCHCDFVFTRVDGLPHCMLCDLPGQWVGEGNARRFIPLEGSRSRWEDEQIRKHFEDLILPSGKRFEDRKEEIRGKLTSFREQAARRDS
jgi:multimeric flavodoxin WrbA